MSDSNTSGGIGFMGALAIAFIVLKLTEVIDWAWIWVLVPIWGALAIGIAVFIIYVVVVLLITVVQSIPKKKKKPVDLNDLDELLKDERDTES